MNQQVVNLIKLGMQQQRAAAAAEIVDGVRACRDDRGSLHDVPDRRSGNDLQADLTVHWQAPCSRGPVCNGSLRGIDCRLMLHTKKKPRAARVVALRAALHVFSHADLDWALA